MYVKAFIVNEALFLEQHINIVNTVKLQRFWFICIKQGDSDFVAICFGTKFKLSGRSFSYSKCYRFWGIPNFIVI